MNADNVSSTPLDLSIVIPVYNEEAILEASVRNLVAALDHYDWTWELLLCENGSQDQTTEIAQSLAAQDERIRSIHVGEPNYGLAMRRGILESTGTIVVCDEIDICDTHFYRDAIAEIRERNVDMVVGSKALATSADRRPIFRRRPPLFSTFCFGSSSIFAGPIPTASRPFSASACSKRWANVW